MQNRNTPTSLNTIRAYYICLQKRAGIHKYTEIHYIGIVFKADTLKENKLKNGQEGMYKEKN